MFGRIQIIAVCLSCLCAASYAEETAPPVRSTDLWDDLPREPVMMWEVSRSNHTAYIVGSLHMGPDDLFPLPAVMDEAFERCETVLFEVDPDELDGSFQKRLSETGSLPAGKTLSRLIDAGMRSRLRDALREVNMPADALERQKPWMAALILTISHTVHHRGLISAENGIDRYFMKKAKQLRKRVGGLESVREQLALFADLDEPTGIEFLRKTLDELDDADRIIMELVEAWKSGDTEDLWAIARESFDQYPNVYATWMTARNARWADRIDAMLNDTACLFVVVGAAHVAGPDSLPALLEARGLAVEQITVVPQAAPP